MQEKCYDIFNELNLPFETYLSEYIDHQDTIHEEMEIIWVIKGNAVLTIDGQQFFMKPQTVFLVYMYLRHSMTSDPNSIIVTFRLKKEFLHKNNLFFEKVKFAHRVYTFDELAVKYRHVPLLIVEIIKLMISQEKTDQIRYKIIGYYKMYIQDLFRMILKEKYLDIKKLNPDDYLNRIYLIVDYTYEHFKEKITLDDLATITGISTHRLSHFIKEVLGVSYREFLQISRFEHALKLLKETDRSVIDIALDCGFSDHKYLNKMMKEKFNTTPLKYRKNMIDHQVCIPLSETTIDFINGLKSCLKKLEEDKRFGHLFGMIS